MVDQADVLLMQNWDHVLTTFKFLNQIPYKPDGIDFFRVREWYLNGRMEHKINSFKDFINCGEFLKKSGYSSKHRSSYPTPEEGNVFQLSNPGQVSTKAKKEPNSVRPQSNEVTMLSRFAKAL